MTIELRPLAVGEARSASDAVSTALLFSRSTDEEWTEREPSWSETDSLCAWEGERCVGHVGAFPLDTTVPGGRRLLTAGVTRVGVLPTHTRRGLLTSMMHQLLRQSREKGKVLASLRASEAVIYGRYGFGVAAEAAAIQVTTRSTGAVRDPAPGSIRLLRSNEVLDIVPALYDRCGRGRTGTVSWTDFLTRRYFADAISGSKQSVVAVHESVEGELDGYVHYDVRWQENADGTDEAGAGNVYDLFGTNAAVERALWAYLLGIDLIMEWRADERPVDDPIRFGLTNTRAYRLRSRWDEQWLRVLDVDAALTARTYRACDRSITVGVRDSLFDSNNGTWRIDAGGVNRTDEQPDVTVGIETLSAAYLGGTSWRELADAGQIEVCRVQALDDADSLFFERPAPFCGSFF